MTTSRTPKCFAFVVGVGQAQSLKIDGVEYDFPALGGVANDITTYRTLLRDLVRGRAELILEVLDHPEVTTPEAILQAIAKVQPLVADGDYVVVVLSGHGMTIPDTNGDEAPRNTGDTLDEVFVASEGVIMDDTFARLWQTFPTGVLVVGIADCCSAEDVIMFDVEPGPTLAGQSPELQSAEWVPDQAVSLSEFAPLIVMPYAPDIGETRAKGLGRLWLSAVPSWENAHEVRRRGLNRGAFTTALEAEWSEGMTLRAWFSAASDWVQRNADGQQPRMRYVGPDRGLLDRPPFSPRT